MIDMICHCGEPYQAKIGDLNRGNGLSHDKSCAGRRRMLKLPAAKRADSVPIVVKKKPLKKRKRISQVASTRHMLKGVKN